MFKIVLFAPEIPGNTGSIGRTCVALDVELILIRPLAFDISEKAVRRAGLDYWKHVQLKTYENFDDFLSAERPTDKQMYFFSKGGEHSALTTEFHKDAYFIFGAETKGLPHAILEKYRTQTIQLPMRSVHIRSLNLANAATAVAYLALAQSASTANPRAI